MEMNVRDGRIYLPAEDEKKPHDRKVVHPETNSDQVIMTMDDSETNKDRTLSEHLGPQIIIGANKPDRACLWLKVTGTETE